MKTPKPEGLGAFMVLFACINTVENYSVMHYIAYLGTKFKYYVIVLIILLTKAKCILIIQYCAVEPRLLCVNSHYCRVLRHDISKRVLL